MILQGILPHTSTQAAVSASVIRMHSESAGKISLRSADPNDMPLIDLNYLSHPYDQRVMIEAVRETVKFIQSSFPGDGLEIGPISDSDDDILVCDFSLLLILGGH